MVAIKHRSSRLKDIRGKTPMRKISSQMQIGKYVYNPRVVCIERLHWPGHVIPMEEDILARQEFHEAIGRTKSRKPCHQLV